MLILWFENLLATDSNNPHYKFLWLPPINNKYIGIVMCDEQNHTFTKNIGPIFNDKSKEL